MGGTKVDGLKAAVTNRARNGKDFYKRIDHTGGFVSNPELVRIAGSKGGKISKAKKVKRIEYEDERVNYQSY